MRICLGQRVMLLRPSPFHLLGNYLLYHLYSGALKARISVLTSGTTNPHLNVGDVRDLKLPLPPPDEQRTVVDAAEALDLRVTVERNCLGTLRAVRAGLADDLLSGRVRTAEGQD
jgi:type I restriction enzyme, S subunit